MKLFRKKAESGTPKPIKKRKKDIRGSITALVVLILVPTIVLEGFLVDLARMKLYGNQAIMTADNYGESVLTVYNNVLKDLYGLFAISSQSSDGTIALDALEGYIASSFNPSSSVISFDHMQGIQAFTGNVLPFNSGFGAQARLSANSGFMPYKDAKITLSYDPIKSSSLAEKDIFSTQIGDFMRFRVAQALMGGEDSLMDAVDMVMGMEANTKAIEKKEDFDNAIENVINHCIKYYENLKILNQYCYNHVTNSNGFLIKVANTANSVYDRIAAIKNDNSYIIYRKYEDNEAAITAARNKLANLKKGESLSESEQAWVDFYNNEYSPDTGARRNIIKNRIDGYIAQYESVLDDPVINFAGFEYHSDELTRYGNNVRSAYTELQSAIANLQSTLNDPSISQSLKDGIQQDIDEVNQLFTDGNAFSANNFTNLARLIHGQTGTNGYNGTQQQRSDAHIDTMKRQRDAYLDGTSVPGRSTNIDTNGYNDFYNDAKYKTFYQKLEAMFEADQNSESETKKKKNKAKDAASSAADSLKEDETSNARDIPSGIAIGKDGTGSFTDTGFWQMIDAASSLFDSNSIAQGANDALLKIYNVIYDTSMFSCLTTNKDDGENNSEEDKDLETTLTGYALCKEINYLYGAELEYLLGGYKDSDTNLSWAKSKIVTFRSISNFAASYAIDEVNRVINAAGDAVKAVNIALAIAVEAALRVAFAMLETVADWEELKAGKGVVVVKTDVDDLTSDLTDLLGISKTDNDSGAFKMDYETYLTIMLIGMTRDDEIATRTGDLISLNVSTVESGLGDTDTLTADKWTFKLSEAYTAINATCAVALDFVVLPMSMANMLLGGDTSTLDEIRSTGFKFTVTRGY